MIRSDIRRRKVSKTQINGAPAYSGGWSGGGSASLPDLTTLQYVPYDVDDPDNWLVPDRKVKSNLGFVGNLEGTLNGRNDQYHPGNANKKDISWSMAEALINDRITFTKNNNDSAGWDGANIRHDNEGTPDKSKLIFELTDDPSDWFEWRIWQAYNTRFNTPLCVRYDYSYFNGKLGVNTNNPTEALHVIGNILASGRVKSDTGEFNSLKVYGNLDVYELTANQTRVTNGDLWIQDSAKITLLTINDGGVFFFRCQDNVMRKNDLCIVQVSRSAGSVMRCAFKVVNDTDRDGDDIIYQAENWHGDYGGLQIGDLIVRVGNTTNPARQSSVLNCVSFGGYGAATLYYSGVESIPVGSFYPDNSKITSAIGDLRELGLGSAATYTTDGHFTGTVNATDGSFKGVIASTDMTVREKFKRMTNFYRINGLNNTIAINGSLQQRLDKNLNVNHEDSYIVLENEDEDRYILQRVSVPEPTPSASNDVEGSIVNITIYNTSSIPQLTVFTGLLNGESYAIIGMPAAITIRVNSIVNISLKFVKYMQKFNQQNPISGWVVYSYIEKQA